MKVAIVGATGLVGRTMMKVLEEQRFPVSELMPVASTASVGKTLLFANRPVSVIGLEEAVSRRPDLALFSAGGGVSLEWAPKFAAQQCVVVDNSSAWRRNKDVPLVVPEVNAADILPDHRIIANPNCSTIQLVMAVAPIHRRYTIRRMVISTYQSVSGSGLKGITQLKDEQNARRPDHPAYPHPIHLNVIPHGGSFEADGYTTEEVKLRFESQKIMHAPAMGITATVVRVPVYGGHSVSVNVETEKPFEVKDIRSMLAETTGIMLTDNTAGNEYPMPLYAEGYDEVFVGRLRRDESLPNALNMWVVADNLRKGAATNAVQIASYMLSMNLLPTR
ncbi:MAG: aspartate-semialdehyde dehydrogenase [Bacteroidales bacterium]|nr:aspartate-semialdehyde dehydrogenase [Bacteroidales bacterium]